MDVFVTQTFFVDDEIKALARLDGIITVIDCKHIVQHLDEEKPEGAENEAVEQVAFADKLLLNKTDLVSEEEAVAIVARLREINKMAPIVHCQNAIVPMEELLNIRAFDLERVLQIEPDFLEDGTGRAMRHACPAACPAACARCSSVSLSVSDLRQTPVRPPPRVSASPLVASARVTASRPIR